MPSASPKTTRGNKARFDENFGETFLSSVPLSSGVYRFCDADGQVIYIGKAKCLRRRLSQYRLAGRKKGHRRMRRVVAESSQLTFEVTASHLDACLLEITLIQSLKPKLNITSAFSFLYPYIGVSECDRQVAMSTEPTDLAGFTIFGAFRSRELVGQAYFSFVQLLSLIGHRNKIPAHVRRGRKRYTYVHSFRQIPDGWLTNWQAFFSGRSIAPLQNLVEDLLNRESARAQAARLQEAIDHLAAFWHAEAKPLHTAIKKTNYSGPLPVPQIERDPLFLRARMDASSS